MNQNQCEKLSSLHKSVLFDELVNNIDILKDKQNIIIDCTLGMGGHARGILDKMNSGDIFIGFDTDNRNLEIVKPILEDLYKDKGIELIFINDNFINLKINLEKLGITNITGIYYDFGLSSLHLDDFDRGFSFRFDSALDMRFDNTSGITAKYILSNYSEKQLSDIFYKFGEEPKSKIIAKQIIELRKKGIKFNTTKEFGDFLDSITKFPKTKPRIFQALRIEVNKELESITKSLLDAIDLLSSGGKIFVISFHSLEDRIVKEIFKNESRDCVCNDLICSCKHIKKIKILTKKPIIPTDVEIKINSRSRSAKARLSQKI